MKSESTRVLSVERGREIAAVAQLWCFGGRRGVRVTTRDGDVYGGTALTALYDLLVVSGGRAGRECELELAEVARIERWELRLGRVFGFGLAVVTLSAAAGMWWTRGSDVGLLTARDGAFLGTIAGALLAALLVWLLQSTPGFHRWRVLLEEDDGPPPSRPAV